MNLKDRNGTNRNKFVIEPSVSVTKAKKKNYNLPKIVVICKIVTFHSSQIKDIKLMVEGQNSGRIAAPRAFPKDERRQYSGGIGKVLGLLTCPASRFYLVRHNGQIKSGLFQNRE